MLGELFKVFFHYVADILPYFFIASFLGAGLQVLMGRRLMKRSFMSKPYAPLITATLGASVPVCSCSMIPVARTLDSFSPRSYAPVMAFLVTAPVLSPVVVVLTFGMLGYELTVMRILLSLAFALVVAYLSSFIFVKRATLPLVQGASSARQSWLKEFTQNFLSLLTTTGKYVLLGLFIASLVKVLVPEGLIISFSSSPLSYPLISLLSIPVYVCSGEEVPIARSLQELGFTQGQVLTFMLASSGICVPTITALFSFLPKGLILMYVVGWFLFATLSGVFMDLLVVT